MWRNPIQNEEERAWRGNYTMDMEPGTLQRCEGIVDYLAKANLTIHALPIPENWNVLYGLAGLVAEHISDGETCPYEITGYIENSIDQEEVSQTDLAAIGENWGETEVESVLKILLDRWESIERSVGFDSEWIHLRLQPSSTQ